MDTRWSFLISAGCVQIIRRANEADETADNLSSRFIDEFQHVVLTVSLLMMT
jgi:hypothetical protein